MSATQKGDTAQRIVDVAERLVQTRGWNGFSYADIADELHIQKASLHYHFPSKAALGKVLIERYTASFLQALDEIGKDGGSPRAKLEKYAQLYVSVLRKQRMCLCGMLAADFEILPKAMRHRVTAFFAANESWLAKLLEDGRRTQTMHFEGSAFTMAEFVVSSLEGAMLVARSYGQVTKFQSVVKQLLTSLARQTQ